MDIVIGGTGGLMLQKTAVPCWLRPIFILAHQDNHFNSAIMFFLYIYIYILLWRNGEGLVRCRETFDQSDAKAL